MQGRNEGALFIYLLSNSSLLNVTSNTYKMWIVLVWEKSALKVLLWSTSYLNVADIFLVAEQISFIYEINATQDHLFYAQYIFSNRGTQKPRFKKRIQIFFHVLVFYTKLP